MKKLIIAILLFPVAIVAQQPFKETSKTERVYFESGLYLPIGGLRDIVKPSFNYGFWFRMNVRENENLDIGFNLTAPNSNQPFEYRKHDSIFAARAKTAIGMVGVRYNRMYKIGSKSSVEIFPSLGYALLGTQGTLIESAAGGEEQVRKSRILSAVHVGQGFRINRGKIGFQAQYQFTPYAWFSSIDKDFGMHSITVGILYRQ